MFTFEIDCSALLIKQNLNLPVVLLHHQSWYNIVRLIFWVCELFISHIFVDPLNIRVLLRHLMGFKMSCTFVSLAQGKYLYN